MENEIVMVYKTNEKYQEVEGLISFLASAGINALRSPHSVIGSALDQVNGICIFVNKEQEEEAKILKANGHANVKIAKTILAL